MTTQPTPASDAGKTVPAGAGLSDEDMSRTVAHETSPDLAAEDVFEREAAGGGSDKPAADLDADDVS